MAQIRTQALNKITTKPSANGLLSNHQVSAYFGENVFGISAMKEYLAESTFKAILAAIRHGVKVDFQTAENVAKGMKKWAMDRGATHFTHWFQPLTGLTAEKHDAFFKPGNNREQDGIESLSGRELVQREPDASSFPSGGLRNTSSARGYTIWDPTSPAFILDVETGKTLYVPSVFISYTGDSLDNKAPLLQSIEALSTAATRVANYFDPSVRRVVATLGWEQEYFVVDENLFMARPDLVLTGRTLFGARAAKGQEKSDHYFGTIPERVQRFMNDFEKQCFLLGIPLQTRHNEVAPGQYEVAPMFEELNTAIDHNLLLMRLMEQLAGRHGLRVLFHEKPFAGVNGSGKHNNWSLATDTGVNLLNPGEQAAGDLRFLTFFIIVIKAIDAHADLLRASIASSGNDHRLGANEAPPAIISAFTGKYLEEVLAKFKKEGLDEKTQAASPNVEVHVPRIPEMLLDNTDRNRTSPFPFTGNKFEFRAVGASANPAFTMTVLNTIVADQLTHFAEAVAAHTAKGKKEKEAIVEVLQGYVKESERIIFNGNGYAPEWEKEAAKRGLANVKSSAYALERLSTPEAQVLFAKYHVFNKNEIEARVSVLYDNYCRDLETESLLIEEMAYTHIIAGSTAYLNRLIETFRGYKELKLEGSADHSRKLIETIQAYLETIQKNVEKLAHAREKAEHESDLAVRAKFYHDKIKPYFVAIREAADALELLVDDSEWKLPKYRELLFVR